MSLARPKSEILASKPWGDLCELVSSTLPACGPRVLTHSQHLLGSAGDVLSRITSKDTTLCRDQAASICLQLRQYLIALAERSVIQSEGYHIEHESPDGRDYLL